MDNVMFAMGHGVVTEVPVYCTICCVCVILYAS